VLLAAVASAVLLPGCARRAGTAARAAAPYCQFVVHNQTPSIVEVRLQVRDMATLPIGTLNPGELLTHEVPCARQRVLVEGLEVPWVVGATGRFGVLYGEATLVESQRPRIALHWP